MPKCPKCKEKINTLINVQSGFIYWTMNKKADYTGSINDFNTDDSVNEWCCPECNETLFNDEQDAIDFLNNKHKKEE